MLLVMLAALPSFGTEMIDRIVATVNGHIILQSDWDDALCYEAFVAGHPLDKVTASDRKDSLDRLIDQELLREQIRITDTNLPSEQRVEDRLTDIRKSYPAADTDQKWQALLAKYDLTPPELRSHVVHELELLRLVQSRLRPSVQIDPKSIESYYNEELLPQLRQEHAKELPLAEVTPQIRELLTEQKVNQLLTAWLQTLRAGSEIHSQVYTPNNPTQ